MLRATQMLVGADDDSDRRQEHFALLTLREEGELAAASCSLTVTTMWQAATVYWLCVCYKIWSAVAVAVAFTGTVAIWIVLVSVVKRIVKKSNLAKFAEDTECQPRRGL